LGLKLLLATKEIRILFARFLAKLRTHPWLKNSKIVLFVERNTAAGAEALEAISQAYKNTYVLMDRDGEHAGWWTTWAQKAAYAISGSEQMRENKISFINDPVCENPWLPKETKWEITRNKLLEQLPRYKSRLPTEGTRKRKLPIISGTINEEGKKIKGQKDDLALSFFMALFFLDNILRERIPGIDYRYIKGD
jgi:hypothetical protein